MTFPELEQTAPSAPSLSRIKRTLTEQAIAAATAASWEEAAEINRKLIEYGPEAEAENRLAKSLWEMGDLGGAREHYQKALALDPTSRIAERNIDRLKLLMVEAGDRTVAADPTSKAPVSIFVEETGKTGFAHLMELARPKVLAQVNPGDDVELVAEGKHLIAFSNGIRVGVVEPRVAARLLKLVANGNKYAAGVTSLGAQDVRIIIREIYQDPRNYGKVSFPTAAQSWRPPPVHEGHPPARGRGPRGRSRGRHRGRGDRGPRSRHPRRGHAPTRPSRRSRTSSRSPSQRIRQRPAPGAPLGRRPPIPGARAGARARGPGHGASGSRGCSTHDRPVEPGGTRAAHRGAARTPRVRQAAAWRRPLRENPLP